jgi:hypothetical protein
MLFQNLPEGTEEITTKFVASKDGLKCEDLPLVRSFFFSGAFLSWPCAKPLKKKAYDYFSSV